MSPDDIFAAQFWPWPDPAIKRDNQGRVLFVNAAFLQLYGGTVQEWTGNVVGGWPTPQGPGQPYRFETRIPMTHELAEQVYDWIEMTLADGNAFALARNVSIFAQAPAPQVTAELPAQAQQMNIGQIATHEANETAPSDIPASVYETQYMPAQNPNEAPVFEQSTFDAPQYEAPIYETPVTETPASYAPQNVMPNASHEPVIFAEHVAEPQPEVLGAQPLTNRSDNAQQIAPATGQAPEITTPPAQAAETLSPQQSPALPALNVSNTPDRAYERRALPLENESAVLGSNWRDAVIAKAVGAGAPPAADPAATQPSMAANGTDDLNGPKRILLAEDNAINALLTRTLLEAEGHTVETVQDGQLAVEAMKTSTYDLIFMDMRMPNMDGLEATRKIRTLPNVSRHLPIIALTANAFDDDRNACFDSGMNDFMTKPVSAEELSEMVAQWTSPKQERLAS